MNINFKNKWLLPSALALAVSTSAQASASGSETITMGYMTVIGQHITTEETIYIGPGTYQIDGTWEVYSKYIVIDPAAVISGSGTIQIYNPCAAGGAASRTFIDGNASNNAIEVNIVLNNASGMELFNKDFPTELTDNGFTNNPASSTYIGKDLDLAVNGADIWLDADAVGDLRFDNNATISNYSVDRMIITNNSSISHVVRDAGSTGFFFPIGIADGDYTPTNIVGGNAYHVSVQDYEAATPTVETPSEGMDRIWHVFGGTATSVALHHNSPGTDGGDYTDADAFITRYLGSGEWSTGTAEQTSTGVHTNTGAIGTGILASASADASYLTKTSDAVTPLPVKLISFDAYKKGNAAELLWATASEQNNKGFDIERSTDGRTFIKIGFIQSLSESGNSNVKLEYNFTDNTPANGQNFYRLKQVDFDGKFEYSVVRTVWFDAANTISIYPNPATDNVNISDLQGGENITVYDVSGRLMYQLKAEKALVNIPLIAFSSGTYHISIIGADGSISSHKVVKN